jgi:hypothetical protein
MEALDMLAYLFWHRPFKGVDRKLYEEALMRFQSDLAAVKPAGVVGAASFRIEPVHWLDGLSGYEDWYLLDGSWAIDSLNAFAIAGHMQEPHDKVAALMEHGHGGLYAHVGGETALPEQSTIYWLTRPRSIQWRAAIDPFRAQYPHANIWRRQMVLGPAAEFGVEMPGDEELEAPSRWEFHRVRRTRLPKLIASNATVS